MTSRPRDAKIERLRRLELFKDADKKALEALASAADEATISPGTTLMSEGHLHNEGYLIVSGSVEVTVGGKVVAEIPAGELIGELALLTAKSVASATVKAKTEAEVLVIPYNRFDKILDDNPGLTKEIATQLAHRLIQMDQLFEQS